MSVQAMTWVIDYSETEAVGDRLVMIALANYARADGSGAWPSIERLARDSRLSERAVYYSLSRLEAIGELRIQHGAGPHGVNIYDIVGMRRWPKGRLAEGGANIAGVQSETDYPAQIAPNPLEEPSYTVGLSNAHAQSSFVPTPEPPARKSRTKRVDEDKTLPPTKYKVGDDMWKWAQEAGWGATRADLQIAADTCFEWYTGKGQRQADWIATLKVWVRRNIKDGDDLKMARRHSGTGDTGGNNGRDRHGPGPVGGSPGQALSTERRYGYNGAGQPTNRATATGEAARHLAARQREREEAEQAGGDDI